MEILKNRNTWRYVLGVATVGLLSYVIILGLTATIPYQSSINGQTSRNVFFHVPMWFAMMFMMYTSTVHSIRFLNKGDLNQDAKATAGANTGIFFGILGLVTGIVWARVTWCSALPDNSFAAWWPWDPHQTTALICILIYLGYFVLRRSFDEPVRRAKISAVYNVFAAATIIPLFYVIPKAVGGLHPRSGTDEGSISSMGGGYSHIFWPAAIAFLLLSIWIFDTLARINQVQLAAEEMEEDFYDNTPGQPA